MKHLILSLFLFSTFYFYMGANSSSAQQTISYDYNIPDRFNRNRGREINDAVRVNARCFKITEEENNRRGAVWFNERLDLTRSFELEFLMYFGNIKTQSGADGFGFVMHDDPKGFQAVGDDGGGLNFGRHPSKNHDVITRSVGIEFDTYQNGEDPKFNHTTVITNGLMTAPRLQANHITPFNANDILEKNAVRLHPLKDEVADGECYKFRVIYDVNTNVLSLDIELEINGEETWVRRFDYPINLAQSIGNNNAIFGFTGSTGGAKNEHTVCILQDEDELEINDDFVMTDVNVPVNIDVLENDIYPIGTLGITNFTEPENGQIELVTVDGQEVFRYVPNPNFTGEDTFTYESCDVGDGLNTILCNGYCGEATVFITVGCPDPPAAVEAELIRDNLYCDLDNILPPTGSAQAWAIDDDGNRTRQGYSFEWFEGDLDAPQGTPISTNAIAQQLGGGTFTVFAIDNATGCISAPDTVNLVNIDEIKFARAEFILNANTNCEDPNGSVEIQVFNDETNEDITNLFTFQWFPIDNLGDEDFIISTSPSINNLIEATYAVIITEPLSSCTLLDMYFVDTPEDIFGNSSNGTNVVIGNQTVTPEFDIINISANTICNGTPDGTASVVVTNLDELPPSNRDFEVRWFLEGNNSSTPDFIGENQTELPAGNHKVEVVYTISQCAKQEDFTIEENTILPVLSFDQTPNTFCVNPNGSITAGVTNLNESNTQLADYSFEWVDALGDPVTVSGTNGRTAEALVGGDYEVLVTNTITGCSVRETVILDDNIEKPSIIGDDTTPNTWCVNANGTVSLDYADAATPATNFSFVWRNANGQVIATTTTPELAELAAGTYSVRVTNTDTGCRSDRYDFTIDEELDTFSLSVDTTPNTWCGDNGNGTATANISMDSGEPFDIDEFTFTFVDANSGDIVGNESTATSLLDGDYLLTVRNTITGCRERNFEFTIATAPATPETAILSSTPQMLCSPPNGSITVEINSDNSLPQDEYLYEFLVEGEIAFSETAASTSFTWDEAPTDTYAVRITNTTTECSWNLGDIEVEDNTPTLNVDIGSPSDDQCIRENVPLEIIEFEYEGTIYTTLDQIVNGLGFEIQWFFGSNPDFETAEPFATNVDSVENILPGNYTVSIFDPRPNSRVCRTSDGFEIDAVQTTPVFDLLSEEITSCTNFDGKITLNVRDETLEIYGGTLPNGDAITPATVNGEKPNHKYFSYYIFKGTSPNFRFDVVDGQVIPVAIITENDFVINQSTNRVDGPTEVLGSNIFNATTDQDDDLLLFELTENELTINGLAAGDYTIAVGQAETQFDDGGDSFTLPAQCVRINDFITIEKADNLFPEFTVEDITRNTFCEGGTGSFTIAGSNLNNLFGSATYTAQVFAVDNVDQDIDITTLNTEDFLFNESGQNAENLQVEELPTGLYRIVLTNEASGCFTEDHVQIRETLRIPLVEETITAANICAGNGTLADITLRITNLGSFDVNDFNFEWFADSDESTSLVDFEETGVANSASIENIIPATVYARVTNTVTGCSRLQAIEVPEQDPQPILITLNGISDPIQCVEFEPGGTIEMSANNVLGGDDGFAFLVLLNGTVAFDQSNVTEDDIVSFAPAVAGEYEVIVTDLQTNCSATAFIELEVDRPSIPFNFDLNAIPIGCNEENIPLGEVSIMGIDPNEYQANWYNVNPLNDANAEPIQRDADTTTPFVLSGVPNGNYWAEVIDGLGCREVRRILIDLASPNIPINVEVFEEISMCDAENESFGRITASVTGFDADVIFDFIWFEDEALTIPVSESLYTNDDVSSTFDPVTPGTYWVQAVASDPILGCFNARRATLTEFPVEKFRINSSVLDVTRCDIDNGEIIVSIDGAPGSSFSFDLFRIGGAPQLVASESGNGRTRFTELASGDYRVEVLDLNTMCRGEVSLTIAPPPVIDLAGVEISMNGNDFCDEDLFNGSLSIDAIAGDELFNFEFDWFRVVDGQSVEQTAQTRAPVATGPVASNLEHGSYFVRITDRRTACIDYVSDLVIDDRTLDILPPTARLENPQTSCDPSNPTGSISASVMGSSIINFEFIWYNERGREVARGATVNGLAKGNYQVEARNRITGCISSGRTTINVPEEFTFPNFRVNTEPSNCEQDNGRAVIELIDTSLEIDFVYWRDGSDEFIREDLAPDTYEVTVVSTLGCESTQTVEIVPDILVYNGVSANGDGLNDFFFIDCLDSFPNNRVRIFNRAGETVFEMNFYNNNDRVFEGFGNRGVYAGSRELPAGTYFYVVDRGDGTRPVNGYLELIR
ncbi:MAG: gliding motility-associated C-terminal domain-containing protein [Cyclobacteriaceae bacterium]|nr:gliding motility-associated C-terminal domain-containing protein [Cyclobacteriaceae bacterium]